MCSTQEETDRLAAIQLERDQNERLMNSVEEGLGSARLRAAATDSEGPDQASNKPDFETDSQRDSAAIASHQQV